MKFRNKKTGQKGNFIINVDHFECINLDGVPEYKSLAKLNEEWEDYGSPEEYWFIDSDGELVSTPYETEYDEDHEAIGNYFETKEKAEKAVEKLKAWKRLRDKGFKIVDWNCATRELQLELPETFFPHGAITNETRKDLNLLFGGEEQ